MKCIDLFYSVRGYTSCIKYFTNIAQTNGITNKQIVDFRIKVLDIYAKHGIDVATNTFDVSKRTCVLMETKAK